MKLTPKQRRFADEYLIDLNATQAAIRAGYSPKTAGQIGEENLKKPEIQKALQERMKARSERTGITQDRVLQEYARLAFFDPRKLFDESGNLKRVSELDEDVAAIIAGMDVVEIGNAQVGEGLVRKLKLADKLGALNSVARHLGMFNDKLNVNHTFSGLSDEELDDRIRQIEQAVCPVR
jgi:phage terminase small subunit